jgi:hypothetical protein
MHGYTHMEYSGRFVGYNLFYIRCGETVDNESIQLSSSKYPDNLICCTPFWLKTVTPTRRYT